MIATVAFALSLTTGKAVSNVVGNILESGVSDNGVRMEMPPDGQNQEEQTNAPQRPTFNDAFVAPENEELDVSLTTQTVLQLAGITVAICLVSITIPSVYVLRLTPDVYKRQVNMLGFVAENILSHKANFIEWDEVDALLVNKDKKDDFIVLDVTCLLYTS